MKIGTCKVEDVRVEYLLLATAFIRPHLWRTMRVYSAGIVFIVDDIDPIAADAQYVRGLTQLQEQFRSSNFTHLFSWIWIWWVSLHERGRNLLHV